MLGESVGTHNSNDLGCQFEGLTLQRRHLLEARASAATQNERFVQATTPLFEMCLLVEVGMPTRPLQNMNLGTRGASLSSCASFAHEDHIT
jgi:hypothetical protein